MINIFETPQANQIIEEDYTGNQYKIEFINNKTYFITRGEKTFSYSLEYIMKKFSFVSPENQ